MIHPHTIVPALDVDGASRARIWLACAVGASHDAAAVTAERAPASRPALFDAARGVRRTPRSGDAARRAPLRRLAPDRARSSASPPCCCRSRADGAVDWSGFESLLGHTVEAGLVPAVNMDTGYVQLLDADTRDTRARRRRRARAAPAGFVAGAFVADEPGAPFDLDAYLARDGRDRRSAAARRSCSRRTGSTRSTTRSGSPRTTRSGGGSTASSASSSARCSCRTAASTRSPRTRDCSASRACIGAKHSSLSRGAEWDRLAVRDRVRPDFHVFTGNDLAIDMVCYGSDYLLGLSAFAPEAFAERDRRWAAGDRVVPRAQRPAAVPRRLRVPARRCPRTATTPRCSSRSAAGSRRDATPPGAPRRPDSDRAVLADIAERLEALL